MRFYAIGIDLLISVFQTCGVNQRLNPQFYKKKYYAEAHLASSSSPIWWHKFIVP